MTNTRKRLEEYMEQRNRWQRHLAEQKMTETEASCLMYLGMRNIVGIEKAISIGRVFDELIPPCSSSRISATLGDYYQQGLITKRINPESQRSTLISLTAKGYRAYQEIESLFAESSGAK